MPLIAGFILLFASAGTLIWLSWQQQALAGQVRHALEVESQLNRVQTLVTDAETGQRGYLLTGRDVYLQPFLDAKNQVLGQIDTLAQQTAGDPDQQDRAGNLRTLAIAKLAELERTVTLRSSGHTDEALAIVNDDSGNQLVTQIRAVVADMQAREERRLQYRSDRAERVNILAQVMLGFSVLLILGVAFLAIRDGRRRLLELQSANIHLQSEIVERAAAEGQVRQLQKIEAVGQLTGGIAHDFNNMLAIIIGSLDMARRRLSGTEHPRVPQGIDGAVEGAQRAAALTARLLAFSRRQPLDPRNLDANKLVGGMSELLRRTIGEQVQIETVLGGGLWNAYVDPAQVESALLNLVVNARDAMPGGGKLTIETANADLDDRYARAHAEVTAGQYVQISVTDTGAGMAPETIERAFEPFFTTKEVGRGTGLGLSQVFGFVKQSGGHIKIYSELGHGTTVKLYLPRHLGTAAEIAADGLAADIPAGTDGEVILVVEDEAAVRQIAVDALEELGYTVIQAADPAEALLYLQRQPVSLLFTDIVMPGMTGRQLADRARETLPELKVLYITGYTRNAVVHNGVIDPGTHLLQKPFTLEQLAGKVRQVLGQPVPPPEA
jgi:signal transduction histidine kinase